MPGSGRSPGEGNGNPLQYSCLENPMDLDLPCSSDGEESACNAGDLGLLPGSGGSSREGNGNPLQYSCLKNPMDRGAWWATVHGVAESDMTEWLTPLLLSMLKNVLKKNRKLISVKASCITTFNWNEGYGWIQTSCTKFGLAITNWTSVCVCGGVCVNDWMPSIIKCWMSHWKSL